MCLNGQLRKCFFIFPFFDCNGSPLSARLEQHCRVGFKGLSCSGCLGSQRVIYVMGRLACSTMARAVLVMSMFLQLALSKAQGLVNASSAVEIAVAEVRR